MKSRAAIYHRIRPHAAAVAMDDALHNRQPDARAFKFVCAMQSLKDSEQFFRILHVKTRAVVADEKNIFIVLPNAADFKTAG